MLNGEQTATNSVILFQTLRAPTTQSYPIKSFENAKSIQTVLTGNNAYIGLPQHPPCQPLPLAREDH